MVAGCGGGGSTTVIINKTVTAPSGGTGASKTPSLKPFRVPSQSMLPSLPIDTVVRFDPGAYGSSAPRRGDVIVFHPPKGAYLGKCRITPPPGQVCMTGMPTASGPLFIKRIVALPGDTVAIKAGRVYVNGSLNDPWPINRDRSCGICNLPDPAKVPDGSYFLVGDNRGESADSREWGPVQREWIVGKVVHP